MICGEGGADLNVLQQITSSLTRSVGFEGRVEQSISEIVPEPRRPTRLRTHENGSSSAYEAMGKTRLYAAAGFVHHMYIIR